MQVYNDPVFCDDIHKSYKIMKTRKAFIRVDLIGKGTHFQILELLIAWFHFTFPQDQKEREANWINFFGEIFLNQGASLVPGQQKMQKNHLAPIRLLDIEDMCAGSELQGDFHESIPTFLEVKSICQFLEPELCSHKSSIKTLEFG